MSDDDRYDAQFQDHPLSRVRLALRRAERTFRIAVETDASSELNSAPPPHTDACSVEFRQIVTLPKSKEEMIDAIGTRGALNITLEALRKPGDPPTVLADRQNQILKLMAEDTGKMLDAIKRKERLQARIRARRESLLKELKPETAHVWIARLRDSSGWLTLPAESGKRALLVFTSAAFIDDFLEAKQIDAQPECVSLKALGRLLERNHSDIEGLEFNQCPRCGNPPKAIPLSRLLDESELLKTYSIIVSIAAGIAENNHTIAMLEKHPAKKQAQLQYTLDHIDPGAAAMHVELGKMAAASGDTVLLERSRRMLAKYEPESLRRVPDRTASGPPA